MMIEHQLVELLNDNKVPPVIFKLGVENQYFHNFRPGYGTSDQNFLKYYVKILIKQVKAICSGSVVFWAPSLLPNVTQP